MNKLFMALSLAIITSTARAQIIRPVDPNQSAGTNMTISGTGITESPLLFLEDSILNTFTQTAGGAGAGKIVLGDLTFRKPLNSNSIPFINAAGKGAFISSLKFSYLQKNALVMSLTLSNVVVSKYKVFSSDCSGNNCSNLYEEITVNFQQAQFADNAGHIVSVSR